VRRSARRASPSSAAHTGSAVSSRMNSSGRFNGSPSPVPLFSAPRNPP
jgi:hypothetical protein